MPKSEGDQDLAKRVRALEDERDILHAVYSTNHGLDNGVKDLWLDSWTDDGAFEIRRRDGTKSRNEGRAALERMVAGYKPTKFSKRAIVAPVITLEGDEARVMSYFIRFDERDMKTPFLYAFGRYTDHAVRCPDGKWRLKERIADVEAEVG